MKKKGLRMNRKVMTNFLQALYSTHKNLECFFNHLLTCLKKDTSVLLKVINI